MMTLVEALGTRGNGSELGGKDNGHDDTVDGHDLTEDNGNEILGTDVWGLDGTTQDGGPGDEDTPGGTADGETNAHGNTNQGPEVGGGLLEELSNVKVLTPPGEEETQGVDDDDEEDDCPDKGFVAIAVASHGE